MQRSIKIDNIKKNFNQIVSRQFNHTPLGDVIAPDSWIPSGFVLAERSHSEAREEVKHDK